VKFFQVRRDETSRHTGDINAAHKWGLPGIHCPTCDTTWSSTGTSILLSISPLCRSSRSSRSLAWRRTSPSSSGCANWCVRFSPQVRICTRE